MGSTPYAAKICVLLLLVYIAEAGYGVFNVLDYGAVSDGSKDCSQAFLNAWKATCESEGSNTLLIPKGKFLVGPVTFVGPCKGDVVHFQVKGKVIAPSDVSKFDTDGWICFNQITGLEISGGGAFDGQGASAWAKNDCSKSSHCRQFPANIRFNFLTNAIISHITSLNSKLFHINILGCNNITLKSVNVTAPEDSPNTDGIHIGRSTGVNITHSVIATGDDCVSIGPGSIDVTILDVTCGPGHGFSVGSLGKYQDEEDVNGVTVRNCTLRGSSNGVRIKTWPKSPVSAASNLIFEDIVMENVQNPIIIDQVYCPYGSCSQEDPSRVKISNVSFNKIRGTSTTKNAISIVCSKSTPCEDVKLGNINLEYVGTDGPVSSTCSFAKATLSGNLNPPACN